MIETGWAIKHIEYLGNGCSYATKINHFVIMCLLDRSILPCHSRFCAGCAGAGEKPVDVSGQVRMKLDRRARALVMTLCLAPVALPLLAAGGISLTRNVDAWAAVQAPESASSKPQPVPVLRVSIEDPLLSPKPMAAQMLLVTPPVSHTRPATQRPRVNGAHVLREVAVLDGLQISGEGLVVALAGVAPVPAGSECRRLDGVVEACAVRAASRLEVLTRGRPVVCDLQEADEGDLRGACRAGKIDLAEDLVRNGLAVRASVAP